MRRPLALLPLLGLGSGCFVLEEIDKGHAIMDKHASAQRREAEAAEKRAAEEEAEKGGLLGGLQEQVAGLGGWLEEVTEEAPPERDPDDTAVRCRISGRTHFLRKSDCRIRGGRVL